MWFLFALITFLAWGTADFFYKKSADPEDRYSHLKTSIAVGLVMGAMAIATLLIRQVPYDPRNLLIYLPVSSMYIISMTVGYFGIRFLQVSISSPIQNASGAVSAILLMIVLHELPDTFSLIAIALITAGVILLGVHERREDLRTLEKPYGRSGFAALMFPVAYCILDSLGTFFDGWYLDDVATTPLVGVTEETLEDVANISYQLIFLFVALLLLIYLVFIRRERITPRGHGTRFTAALLESAGQLTYVYALSGNSIVTAPLIGSYCVFALLLGRLFLRERLARIQYAAIALVIGGILLLGVLEGLAG